MLRPLSVHIVVKLTATVQTLKTMYLTRKNLKSFARSVTVRIQRDSISAGRELMVALQTTDRQTLDQAVTLLQNGKAQEAKALLQPLLKDPTILAILRQLGG